jgi:methylenetetrahydrofolate reductase (NADPH)
LRRERGLRELPAGGDYRPLVATATAAPPRRLEPVPHVAARNLKNRGAHDDFVKRAAGEAAVTRMLLIAGDRPAPKGPFASSADLLATGAFERNGIRAIGIAGHPEGHPSVPLPELAAALATKQGLALAAGLDLFVVTQFAFDARPILTGLAAMRHAGIAAPVRIGVAGPAHLATPSSGLRSPAGSVPSLRMLRDCREASDGSRRRRSRRAGSTGCRRSAAMPGHGVTDLHFFPFGGLRRRRPGGRKDLPERRP